MSGRLIHLAIHTRGITLNEKLVLAVLADYADDAKGICRPSQQDVATISGLSPQCVNSSIANLAKIGLIEIVSRDGISPTYRVNLASATAPHVAKGSAFGS